MLTAPIKSQINKMRDDLWSGGVSNPMTGVEQLVHAQWRSANGSLSSNARAARSGPGPPSTRSATTSAMSYALLASTTISPCCLAAGQPGHLEPLFMKTMEAVIGWMRSMMQSDD